MEDHKSYSTSFVVAASPEEAFAAASRPDRWWGEMAKGTALRVGDKFAWDVPGQHFSAFEVTQYEPAEKITWKVVRTNNPHEADEWVGTNIEFAFEPAEAGTKVTFTHRGLTPALGCFAVCSEGWNHHLNAGLRAELDGAEPEPLTYETVAEVSRKIHSDGPVG